MSHDRRPACVGCIYQQPPCGSWGWGCRRFDKPTSGKSAQDHLDWWDNHPGGVCDGTPCPQRKEEPRPPTRYAPQQVARQSAMIQLTRVYQSEMMPHQRVLIQLSDIVSVEEALLPMPDGVGIDPDHCAVRIRGEDESWFVLESFAFIRSSLKAQWQAS